jgi:glucokinase
VTARDVFAAAAAGDAYARSVVARTGEYLAVAVANLVNLFDPERVIVGGGLTHTKGLLLDALGAALAHWTAGPADGGWTVAPAGLGADAGIAGAMAVALRGLADDV